MSIPMPSESASEHWQKPRLVMDEPDPKSTPRSRTAGGFASIVETARYALKHGVGRTLRSLAVVNQKGGIACPSCAWPEPDGDHHPAEFCENGAKAIAWEATGKHVDPDFFTRFSIAELSAHSEQWL